MTWLGNIIYKYHLSKFPDRIPYEKLSSEKTWKLQQQLNLHDITFCKLTINLIKSYIIIPIKGLWFRLHYYRDGNGIYNSLTDKFYYVHDEKGLYKVLEKPCKIDCKYCVKTYNNYPKYVLKEKT